MPPPLELPDFPEPDLFEPDLFEPDLCDLFDLFDFAFVPPPHFPEPPVTAAGALITSLANCFRMLVFMVFIFFLRVSESDPHSQLYQKTKYGTSGNYGNYKVSPNFL